MRRNVSRKLADLFGRFRGVKVSLVYYFMDSERVGGLVVPGSVRFGTLYRQWLRLARPDVASDRDDVGCCAKMGV